MIHIHAAHPAAAVLMPSPIIKLLTHLSNPVMLGEPVVVKDGEHQGLVKCVGIRKILELEGFVEEWIQSFSMNFCFKFFGPLRLW